ncbi:MULTISPECIES: CHC2 zinc finger domain-containing protein [unclassified Bradyrhizobium]|uniref:DUF7146 domain-containing protein n=1 Tax=unclassified Bradyrhizobium TaxID=2631580 RepID=UPI0029171188|nr:MULTISPECIES: CHC2 zinc finger domain-containing protein [unclassified Bradyrhizobium]
MITQAQLAAIRAANPVDELAGKWVKLRRYRKGYIGPCPICSTDPAKKGATKFECDADSWKCVVCANGGDVIELVARREGLDFRGAVEWLGGAREVKPTPEIAKRAGQRAHKDGDPLGEVPAPFGDDPDLRMAYVTGWTEQRKRADFERFARERERRRLYSFWRNCSAGGLDDVRPYLVARGIHAPVNARLRLHLAMPFFADGREQEPRVVHIGPAMLAPILSPTGVFAGLHITWLASDLSGKARILDPETGVPLKAKKIRGSKAGGYIDLGGCAPGEATRMIAGEGIETVLSVYTAMLQAGRDLSRTVFRSGVDLGNLAGRAAGTVAHPTNKTAAGRAERVPGPTADKTSPAMPVPESTTGLVLLGDGDSDPFTTRNAMTRAAERHAAPGRNVRVVFAPDGCDFNDLIRRKGDSR